jgi:hypothetical protein
MASTTTSAAAAPASVLRAEFQKIAVRVGSEHALRLLPEASVRSPTWPLHRSRELTQVRSREMTHRVRRRRPPYSEEAVEGGMQAR